MRVQHLVVGHVRLHGGGEVVEVAGQILLGHLADRPGGQVDDAGVLVDVDRLGQVGVGPPGEDVHPETALAEPLGQLGDVHVQPARVPDARRGQR